MCPSRRSLRGDRATGWFRRAASALHLSQPAISRRVHLLEGELGAPVFDRIRSGVVLTDAGRAFLPHAEALLASMRDGIDAVAVRASLTLDRATMATTETTPRKKRRRMGKK